MFPQRKQQSPHYSYDTNSTSAAQKDPIFRWQCKTWPRLQWQKCPHRNSSKRTLRSWPRQHHRSTKSFRPKNSTKSTKSFSATFSDANEIPVIQCLPLIWFTEVDFFRLVLCYFVPANTKPAKLISSVPPPVPHWTFFFLIIRPNLRKSNSWNSGIDVFPLPRATRAEVTHDTRYKTPTEPHHPHTPFTRGHYF